MGLDGVEIVMALEESFDIVISDAEAAAMCTPRDIIDYVCSQVSLGSNVDVCIRQRAFYEIRSTLMDITGVDRSRVKPGSKVIRFFPRTKRRADWDEFRVSSGLERLPRLFMGGGFLFSPTVLDLVSAKSQNHEAIIRGKRRWNRDLIREVVHRILSEQMSITKFCDDGRLVEDLGLDS